MPQLVLGQNQFIVIVSNVSVPPWQITKICICVCNYALLDFVCIKYIIVLFVKYFTHLHIYAPFSFGYSRQTVPGILSTNKAEIMRMFLIPKTSKTGAAILRVAGKSIPSHSCAAGAATSERFEPTTKRWRHRLTACS